MMATYALMIRIDAESVAVVGAKGEIRFPAGDYVYVGSAKRAWRKRVARHLAAEKKLRWHIDYVLALPAAMVREAWIVLDDCECPTAQRLLSGGATVVAPRLGASDCRCPAHLLRCGDPDSVERTLKRLGFEPLSRMRAAHGDG